MSKLTEYTESYRLLANDILIMDGAGGTRKITGKKAAVELAGLISPRMHRNIYRGANLGSTVTDAQKQAINSGTFDDLFIGDYWTIGETNWTIADMDYFYKVGDTAFNKHHLVMLPSSILYSAQMNSTNTTVGGYMGSAMYTENLEQAKTKISSAFGDMVLTHRDAFTNAVTNGYPSGYAWADSTVELMNEVMVYGTYHYAPMSNGSTIPTKYTTARQQFALFALYPSSVTSSWYWLRDVVSSPAFAHVGRAGAANCHAASTSHGVRPYFCIGVK